MSESVDSVSPGFQAGFASLNVLLEEILRYLKGIFQESFRYGGARPAVPKALRIDAHGVHHGEVSGLPGDPTGRAGGG